MILLDTNVVSALMTPEVDPHVNRWLADQDPSELAICAITRAEIRYGIARLPQGKRRDALHRAAEKLFTSQAAGGYSFDGRAADAYGEIVARRERGGRPIGILDAQIAAIARTHGVTVATRDVGGFADTGVSIVNPFTA